MIYTVTLNPSLDYIVEVNDLKLGATNRTTNENMFPGGKGINVSIVLNNLGLESKMLGFVSGFTGDEIKRMINEKGLKEDFIKANDGMSRINVKIKSNEETEVNGLGPNISKECIETLFSKLDELREGDTLVLSGSIPKSISKTIYQDIMKKYSDKGILILVDATNELLTNVLSLRPFLIKPNKAELEEIFNVTLDTEEDIISCASKLQMEGARNIIVSMAGDGAIMLTENNEVFISKVPKGKVVNSVGAGDSMVAGFIYGYTTFKDYEKAFKYAVCTGSASAFSVELAKKSYVEELLKTI